MRNPVEDGMAALRRGYVEKLRITLAGLQVDWDIWCAGEVEGGLRLRQAVHRLYGSGATYGFEALSEAAERLETRIEVALAPHSRPMALEEVKPALLDLFAVGHAIVDETKAR